MSQKQSKYAAKKESGNQMYGPGCCAHKRKADHNQEIVNKLKKGQPNPSRPIHEVLVLPDA